MKKQTLTPAVNRFFVIIKACIFTLLIIFGHFTSFSQSVNQNYVVTTLSRIKGLVDDATLKTASTDKAKVQIGIDYADGLGRSLQTVQWKASPLGNDIVSAKAYDAFGREAKNYLPYVPTGTAGSYRSDAITSAQAASYNVPTTGIVQIPTATQVAYAETKFEASPLNRPVEQGAPGLSWKVGGGHTIMQNYSVNTAADAIKLWVVSAASTGASQSSTYPVGSLNVINTTDEDGNAVILFKDFEDRVISRKVQSGPGTYVVTDYIYDDLGNLRYVLPPASSASGSNTAVTIPSSFTESSTVFLNYFYGYHYDDLGRPIEKKIPGQGWQYIVYNSKDQPIMTQDANQKNLGIWMVSKYDALSRVIMTGKLTSAATRSSLQSSADGSITATFESFTNVTTNYGYTHVSYPDLTGTGGKVLTVTYYDKYDILNNTSVNPSTSVFAVPSTSIDSLEQSPRGLQTAKLVNVLGTSNYIFSMTIYDKEGSMVKTISQHYQGGSLTSTKYDAVESQYSFQKVATQTTRRHYLSSTSTPAVTIISTPSYDHMNRSLLVKQQYITPTITGTTVNINKNDYNELGQLITKHLHSVATGMPANSGFMQHVDYRYNSRGWLSRINNSASTMDETYTTQLDLFGENIDYDQLTNGIGGTPKYNGNISDIKWQAKWSSSITLPQQYKGYVFTYDAMNRLTNADYKAQNSADNTSYNEAITYDELGNILTLTRKNGASSTLNSLVYNYMNGSNRSHMLMSVSDATGTEAYNSSYTYDTNGNLVTDSKKTITSPVLYNELNLPAQVNITTGTKVLKYTYDATGKRLERLTTLAGATVEDRFYVDGIEYVANAIELIHTPEGRATPNGVGGAYIFEYNIADHLGNVRAVFGDKNNDGVLTADEILQTTDYYAFGRQITYSQVLAPNPDNTYLYNGKELQKDLGEYDYGARFYDPVIARWNIVDPLAESSRRWSPYTYALNNPFRFIDPDGMDAQDFSSFFIGSEFESDRPILTKRTGGAPIDLVPHFKQDDGSSYFEHELPGIPYIAGPEDGGGKDGKGNIAPGPNGVGPKDKKIVPLDTKSGLPSQQIDEVTIKDTPINTSHQPGIIKEHGYGSGRYPDFLAGNIAIGGMIGWNIAFTLDRFGNFHWSPIGITAGKSLTLVAGSVTANWMAQEKAPTSTQLDNFLTGHGFNFTAGWWFGGGASWSPNNGKAWGVGFVSPQIGVSYNYTPSGSFFNGKTGIRW